MTNEVLLDFNNVTMQFGGVTALSEVSVKIFRGEILGLIGPNGAGKTTCFNVMTGVYQPTQGTVMFNGSDITKLKRYEIPQSGIARTFQNIRLFSEMTAGENVRVVMLERLLQSLHPCCAQNISAQKKRNHTIARWSYWP